MDTHRITLIALGLAATLPAQAENARSSATISSNFDIIQQAPIEHSEVNLCSQEFAAGDSGAWWASDEKTTSKEQAAGKGSGCVGLSGVTLVVQRGGEDDQGLPKFIVVRDDIAAGQHEYHGLNETGTAWLATPTLSTPGIFSTTDGFALVEVGTTTYLFNPVFGWIGVGVSGLSRVGVPGSLVEAFYSGSQITGVSSLEGVAHTTSAFAGPVALQTPGVASTSALMFHVGPNDLRAFSAYADAWTTIATTQAAPTVTYGENLIVIADGAQTKFYSSFTGNVTTHAGAVTPSITAACAAWIDGGTGYVYRPLDDTILSVGAATTTLQGDEWAGFTVGNTIHLVSAQVCGAGFAVLNLGAQTQLGNSQGATSALIATDTMLHGYSSYDNQWESLAVVRPPDVLQAGPHIGFAISFITPEHPDHVLAAAPGLLGYAGAPLVLPPEPLKRRVYTFSPRESTWRETESNVDEVLTSDRIVLTRSQNVFSAFGTESRELAHLAVPTTVVEWGVEKAYGYVRTPTELHAFSTITDRWYSTGIDTPGPEIFRNGRMLVMLDGPKLVQFRAMPDIQPSADWGTGSTPGVRQLFVPGATIDIPAVGPANAIHTLVAGTARAASPTILPGVMGELWIAPLGLTNVPVGTFSAQGTNTISLPLPPALPGTSTFYMQSLAFDGITMQLGQLLPWTLH